MKGMFVLFPSPRGRMIGASLFGLCLGLILLTANSTQVTFAQSPTSSLTLIRSDADRVVLELQIESYSTREQRANGTIYSVLAIPDFGYTGERGKPQMPVKGTFIGIPPGAQPTLKVLADESRSDPLARPPIPVPTKKSSDAPLSRLPRDLGDVIVPDAATYSANRNYPAEVARITSVGDWRSQHFAVVQFQPLQYNPATRQLIFHRRLRVEITLTYPRGKSPQTLGRALNEGPFESVLRKSLVNYDSAKNWRAKSVPRLPARRSPSQLGPGPWYKIPVSADGIYRVTCAQLQSAGINPATLDTSKLQVFKQEVEIAINVAGSTWNSDCSNSQNYIEFFGQAANAKYTDTNIYWLTYGTSTGKRMPQRSGSGTGTIPTTFTDTLHIEKNLAYVSMAPHILNYAAPPNENYEHWYWDAVSALWGIPSAEHSFQLDYLATDGSYATLQVNLVGYEDVIDQYPNTASHYTRIYINDHPTPIGDLTWSGSVTRSATFPFQQSYLNVGTNRIRVNEPNLTADDLIYVDSFNLSYTRPFTAISDTLRFRQTTSGSWQYRITGFTSSTIETFDITDPFSVTQIVNTTIIPGSPYSTLEFFDSSAPPREYIATAQPKTTTITQDVPSSLRSTSNRADYIIISHGSFASTVQPLATLRATQGMAVQVVDVQDVYDEFSDGLLDPQAIRDFLAYAYGNWQTPAPSFVLLVGDGTYDPKGYCVAGCYYTTTLATLIPPYLRMVDPWLGEAASDNRLVAFNDGTGNTLPQMSIGRLPANSVAEASAMVTKILNYEQNPPAGLWRSTVSFVADSKYKPDPNPYNEIDGSGDFWAASDEIYGDARYTPLSLIKERIYYNACSTCPAPPYPVYSTAAGAEAAINAAINAGRLIVNYTGHGAPTQWSNYPGIFNTVDVNGLTNGNKLPVVLEMTCYTGYFGDPQQASLAEAHVKAAGKGAVANWAPSGWGLVAGHSWLHKGFLDAVMNQGKLQLGPATSYGKGNLIGGSYADLIDTYVLFGDPGSILQIQFALNNHFFLPYIRRQ